MAEFDQKQFALALSVGMGAASEVARRAGYPEAAECIRQYADDWYSKVSPPQPREMVREDIFPPATRYATLADFGFPAPSPSPLSCGLNDGDDDEC